jgi:YHS domain-containing protein
MARSDEKTAIPGESGSGVKQNPEVLGSRRDPEERPAHNQEALREKMLDKTLADSFPTSDPPSSIPDPASDDTLHPEPIEAAQVPAEASMRPMTDPVCERVVNPATATIQADYDNKTFYFCSEECKERFQVNPEPYRNAA